VHSNQQALEPTVQPQALELEHNNNNNNNNNNSNKELEDLEQDNSNNNNKEMVFRTTVLPSILRLQP
jgi:hypothetical protein